MSESSEQESRQRGMLGWFFAHPIINISLFLFLLVICTGVVFHQIAKGRLNRQLAALRAAGMPTSVKDLILTMPDIPDDQNMAIPILEQGWILSGITITAEVRPHLLYLGDAHLVPSVRRLSLDQIDAAGWYLDQAASSLPMIHKALKLDRGCVDIQWKTPAIGVVIPELSQFRRVARTLALEATIAAEYGDTQRAAEVVLDLLRLDRAQECDPFIIGALIRIFIKALAYDQIERAINLCGLSETSLLRLQTELRNQERSDYYKKGLVSERVIFIDTMQWMRTAPNASAPIFSGGAANSVGAYWKYVPILPILDEAAGIARYNSLVDATTDEFGAKTIADVKALDLSNTNMPKYYYVSRTLIPSISRSTELWVRDVAQNRALQATIAVERYRLANGQWPATLDTLVPDYLSAVAVDPFDGKPLRYAHIDEGIKVWSIDLDLVDDHGNVRGLERQWSGRRSKDKGWVLLNPDLRGRPMEAVTK